MNDAGSGSVADVASGREWEDARAFLARHIEHVKRSNISDDSADPAIRAIRARLERDGLPMPQRDRWRVIRAEGQQVAVMHSGPHWGQVTGILSEGRADPRWVARYLTRCWHVEELAVHPDHRRQGYAHALIQDLESAAREAGVKVLTAYGTTDEAVATFTAAGWDQLPPRTPIPTRLAEGLRTMWSDYMPAGKAGAWTYRELAN